MWFPIRSRPNKANRSESMVGTALHHKIDTEQRLPIMLQCYGVEEFGGAILGDQSGSSNFTRKAVFCLFCVFPNIYNNRGHKENQLVHIGGVAMQEETPLKLRNIFIKDYKGIDHLELDFPAPALLGDPDVVVIGSENGLGKSSILECCALSLHVVKDKEFREEPIHVLTKFSDLLIRAGQTQAVIKSTCSNNKAVSLMISNQRIVPPNGTKFVPFPIPHGLVLTTNDGAIEVVETPKNPNDRDFIMEICGFIPNPAIENNLLFFHSYRKIVEGNPRFGTLLNGKHSSNGNGANSLTSIFKRIALFSMMSNADLFDAPKDPNAQETLDKLDKLLNDYASCRFAKLRQTENDGIELRVQPVDGRESFNFDGLSSGQKEIITTLFLIWHETRTAPKVVLIDEPELHLNSQWHRSFINSLIELAPQNQYIIATHSATIMDSVDRSRRILLQKDDEAVR